MADGDLREFDLTQCDDLDPALQATLAAYQRGDALTLLDCECIATCGADAPDDVSVQRKLCCIVIMIVTETGADSHCQMLFDARVHARLASTLLRFGDVDMTVACFATLALHALGETSPERAATIDALLHDAGGLRACIERSAAFLSTSACSDAQTMAITLQFLTCTP